MSREDRFIATCTSWSEFWEQTKKLSSKGEKGAVFERLTQLYLQTTPEYQSELEHVWTLREVPPADRTARGPYADHETRLSFAASAIDA